MSKDESPFEVGYRKPPASGKFTKGKSGNPRGRPKGSKKLANVVMRESRQTVRVNGPRGSRLVTKLEAALMQLGNKAAQGDLRAQRELFNLVRMAEEAANTGLSPLNSSEKDLRVLENLRHRMESISAEAEPTKPEPEPEKEKS